MSGRSLHQFWKNTVPENLILRIEMAFLKRGLVCLVSSLSMSLCLSFSWIHILKNCVCLCFTPFYVGSVRDLSSVAFHIACLPLVFSSETLFLRLIFGFLAFTLLGHKTFYGVDDPVGQWIQHSFLFASPTVLWPWASCSHHCLSSVHPCVCLCWGMSVWV